ncbi:hypothetical protein BSKO_09605 [Bryopsis sp. KO-2023]|nr:hypothetical protein BSKO_09605 [Bryopsis sp. KO-2023]
MGLFARVSALSALVWEFYDGASDPLDLKMVSRVEVEQGKERIRLLESELADVKEERSQLKEELAEKSRMVSKLEKDVQELSEKEQDQTTKLNEVVKEKEQLLDLVQESYKTFEVLQDLQEAQEEEFILKWAPEKAKELEEEWAEISENQPLQESCLDIHPVIPKPNTSELGQPVPDDAMSRESDFWKPQEDPMADYVHEEGKENRGSASNTGSSQEMIFSKGMREASRIVDGMWGKMQGQGLQNKTPGESNLLKNFQRDQRNQEINQTEKKPPSNTHPER